MLNAKPNRKITMETFLGWDYKQWARVMALYEGIEPKTEHDLLMIKRDYLINNRFQPCSETPIIGVKPPMDYEMATKIFNIAGLKSC